MGRLSKIEWMDYKRREKIDNPTRGELAMRVLLRDVLGIRFVEEKRGAKDGICRFYDFFLRKPQIVIEVDGGYHRPEIDVPKEEEIERLYPSWRLIRFTNKEVLHEPEKVAALIKLEIQEQAWGYDIRHVPHVKRGNTRKVRRLLKNKLRSK